LLDTVPRTPAKPPLFPTAPELQEGSAVDFEMEETPAKRTGRRRGNRGGRGLTNRKHLLDLAR
jgi:hypothetical protein